MILRGEELRAAISQFVTQWPQDEKGVRKCPEEGMTQVADFLTEIMKWANSIVLVSRGALFEEGHKDLLQTLLRGATYGLGRGLWHDNNPNFNRLFDEGLSMLRDLPEQTMQGGKVLQRQINVVSGTAFILMWMDPSRADLVDVADGVKEVFKEFGVVAQRVDDIEHQDVITELILGRIQSSEFLFRTCRASGQTYTMRSGLPTRLGSARSSSGKRGHGCTSIFPFIMCPATVT